MNFVDGVLAAAAGGPALRVAGDVLVPLSGSGSATAPAAGGGGLGALAAGHPLTLGIRPEDILLGDDAAACDFRWNADVTLRESLGSETLLWCTLAGARVAVKAPARLAAGVGDRVPLGFSSDRISLFDARTEERV
jgi:multiple sugar transport system ATP-binding protein